MACILSSQHLWVGAEQRLGFKVLSFGEDYYMRASPFR